MDVAEYMHKFIRTGDNMRYNDLILRISRVGHIIWHKPLSMMERMNFMPDKNGKKNNNSKKSKSGSKEEDKDRIDSLLDAGSSANR